MEQGFPEFILPGEEFTCSNARAQVAYLNTNEACSANRLKGFQSHNLIFKIRQDLQACSGLLLGDVQELEELKSEEEMQRQVMSPKVQKWELVGGPGAGKWS